MKKCLTDTFISHVYKLLLSEKIVLHKEGLMLLFERHLNEYLLDFSHAPISLLVLVMVKKNDFFFQIKLKFYDGTYSSSCYSCIIWCRLFYKKIIRYQQWWGYHHSQQMSFILTSLKISIHNLIGRPIWIMEYASNPVKWKKKKNKFGICSFCCWEGRIHTIFWVRRTMSRWYDARTYERVGLVGVGRWAAVGLHRLLAVSCLEMS
jgi:hypothetical protein